MSITVRPARRDDLPAIQRIYNAGILEGVATFDEWPWSDARRLRWFEELGGANVLVAVGATSVVGFTSLSPYGGKSGYRFTREITVCVDPAYQRQGIGRALVGALIEEARVRPLHSLIARIEAENAPSIALFEALGFRREGLQREVGYKHGRWLDVVELQLPLQSSEAFEAAVRPGFRVITVTTAVEMSEALAVRRAVFIEEQGIAEDEEIDALDGDPATTEGVVHVLGRRDGRAVATARLIVDQPLGESPHEPPHIGRVAVLAEHRGSHFGVAIMEALHEEARRRGYSRVTLAAQEYVRGFYERLGYAARGELFLDAGIEHRWMDREL